jgi:nicotinamidase-related amidase
MTGPTRRALAPALVGGTVALAGGSVVAATPEDVERAKTGLTTLLTPENSFLLLVDFQPQFVFSTRSIEIDTLVNNAQGLIKSARAFDVPTILTTVTARQFGGEMLEEIRSIRPDLEVIDRTVINAFADTRIRDAITRSGRRKVIIAGLWTDNCVMLPALTALSEGYDVYFVSDACGDYDEPAYQAAVHRLVQAGAAPVPWLSVLLEWQADWADARTASATQAIMREHAKAISAGAQYLATLSG